MYMQSARYVEKGIYVFLLNDVDAVAARSLREAVEWYEKETGSTQDNEEVHADSDIYLQDLTVMIYLDDSRTTRGTVRSEIKRIKKFPCIIWSTEF